MAPRKLTAEELASSRMLRALELAQILFREQGYHTRYLEAVETLVLAQPGATPNQWCPPTCSHSERNTTHGPSRTRARVRRPVLP